MAASVAEPSVAAGLLSPGSVSSVCGAGASVTAAGASIAITLHAGGQDDTQVIKYPSKYITFFILILKF
jgi:hypothetical protein